MGLYVFYRDDNQAGYASDSESKALARAVDYDVRALARATEARFADPAGAFNVQRFDGAEALWGDVVSACRVLPFLAAHQVVSISGLIAASAQRTARSGDDPRKAGVSPAGLADLAGSLPPTTVLIIAEGTLRSSNAHLKALSSLEGEKTIRPCPGLRGLERAKWVSDEVAARGGTIERAAAEDLSSRLPRSLWAVSCAIDTLLAYVGPGRTITRAAVRELVLGEDEVSAFELSDAIAARDGGRALGVLHDLLARGMAEEQVMASLIGRVRDWTLLAAFRGDKISEAETARELAWKPTKLRAVARGESQFGRGELIRAYQVLAFADEALKSRPGEERRLILDMVTLALASRGEAAVLRHMFPIPPPP